MPGIMRHDSFDFSIFFFLCKEAMNLDFLPKMIQWSCANNNEIKNCVYQSMSSLQIILFICERYHHELINFQFMV